METFSNPSRRSLIKLGFSALSLGLGLKVSSATPQQIIKHTYPPQWLGDAHDIMRRINTPIIRGIRRSLEPMGGDNRERIQSVIDDLSSLGGGCLILKSGRWWVVGPINLRSGIELRIEEGAVVVFSGDRESYLPPVLTRWEGTDLYGYSPCIYAANQRDIAITGGGKLEMARGGDIDSWRFEQTEAQKQLRTMGASGVPLSQRVFEQGSFLRPSFIQFLKCERVLVEGIEVGSIPFWGIHLLYSKHATVRGVLASGDRVNNDGIDIDSSSMVLVESCRFRTGDDCIAIKSGRDLDGRVVGIPSEDIVIRDCVMERGASAGVAIGSEMSGGVRNVYIFRCQMPAIETALNIKSNLDRGGFVERIRVWNLEVGECVRLIQITTSYHGYSGGRYPPRFKDIEVEDLRCRLASEGVVLQGVADSPIKELTLKDISISSTKRVGSLRNVEDLKVENLLVNGRAANL